jgi:hypothetical protein
VLRRFLYIGLFVVALQPLHGQAARVGRFPLLDSLSSTSRCLDGPPTSALRESGVARILNALDLSTGRSITVGLDSAQRPTYFASMMRTTEDRRRETEMISVHFANGTLLSGTRSAFTTGMPARLRDDWRGPLLYSDSARVTALVRDVIRHCG